MPGVCSDLTLGWVDTFACAVIRPMLRPPRQLFLMLEKSNMKFLHMIKGEKTRKSYSMKCTFIGLF